LSVNRCQLSEKTRLDGAEDADGDEEDGGDEREDSGDHDAGETEGERDDPEDRVEDEGQESQGPAEKQENAEEKEFEHGGDPFERAELPVKRIYACGVGAVPSMKRDDGGRGSVERVVAVDWSGDRSTAGQRRKIWAGVWTHPTHDGEGAMDGTPATVRLESGRTREELIEWVIEMAAETPRMVVGVDFCFSYPAWFVEEHGVRAAPELWEIVAERGEHWLSHECEDARFWGRKGSVRDGKKPPEFCGEFGLRMLREADIACKVQGKILDPSEAAKVRGIAPKSPFQIGGAGAVGTGTLRGIPHLARLRKAGFRVWPFDAPALGEGWPLLVEIYPRLLTGEVKKGNAEERTRYLKRKRAEAAGYVSLGGEVFRKARGSEDAFDALVSVMEMAARREDFLRLERATDALTRREGAVWGAKVRAV
jgi:hypothetical protein